MDHDRLPRPGDEPSSPPRLGDPRELLERVRAGHAEARNELLSHCYPRILRMVSARLGPRLRLAYDASDIVQDTMLEACERLDQVDIQEFGQLINWLGKIAHHRITGAARTLDRLPAALSTLGDPSASSGFPVRERSSIPSPASQIARNDQLNELLSALDSLPERHREVICLRDFAEASWAYIAEELGFEGPAGACMLYTRAWKALSAKLGREEL